MPSAAPATDVRVRMPVSYPPGQLQHSSDSELQSKQSLPPHGNMTAETTPRQPPPGSPSTTRPALNRNVASHTSIGSGVTDGSAYLQSDDGSGGVPDFGDTIDSTTFEQVSGMVVLRDPGKGGW